ncbi:MAG TPA: PH domain-containing protein [Pirellulales bacterium]|jgi:hypothetical protein|nr:PH domain-containing protein [Pirellulales bacterium]
MKQAIAGVAPPESGEVTVMTIWPSVAATGCGRFLGKLFAIQAGFWIVSVGRLAALAALPIGPLLYGYMRLPGVVRRYRLTNRRVAVLSGIQPRVERFVDLDRFDTIEVVVRPGQAWYSAGDLIFRRGALETFRLPGVPRPETFRQTCLKARMSFIGVREALEVQTAGA